MYETKQCKSLIHRTIYHDNKNKRNYGLINNCSERKSLPTQNSIIQCIITVGENQTPVDNAHHFSDKNDIMNQYIEFMIDDRNVHIDSSKISGKGNDIQRIKTEIENTGVDGNAFWNELEIFLRSEECFDRVLSSSYRIYLIECAKEKCNYFNEEEYDVSDYVNTHDFYEVFSSKFKSEISDLKTVSEVMNYKFDESIYDYVAFALYKATCKSFYPDKTVTHEFPYVSLITDIKNSQINKLLFNKKYKSQSGLGAEFLVEEPAGMKSKYNNEAVVHTHYNDENSQPSYAHTKPYKRKESIGYGFSILPIDKILGIDDTKKKYSDL